jgi:hypothetical protein
LILLDNFCSSESSKFLVSGTAGGKAPMISLVVICPNTFLSSSVNFFSTFILLLIQFEGILIFFLEFVIYKKILLFIRQGNYQL